MECGGLCLTVLSAKYYSVCDYDQASGVMHYKEVGLCYQDTKEVVKKVMITLFPKVTSSFIGLHFEEKSSKP